MKRKAFLEQCNGEWLDDFIYQSKQVLIDRGFEVVPFPGEDPTILEQLEPNLKDVIFASVEATQKFFELIGITTPEYLGFPESLQPFLHRKIDRLPFETAIQHPYPYFIKPATQVKKFTGGVIENENQLQFITEFGDTSPSDEVFRSEVINIQSEYRCFAHRGELQGIHYYLGDCTQQIDPQEVLKMIEVYDSSPIAYTLDVGCYIQPNGKLGTCLIEVNDMWAIGSYGFDRYQYVSAVIDRLEEIKKAN